MINKIKQSVILLSLSALSIYGQESKSDNVQMDYKPEIHGTVRAKYEYQPEIDAGRFQLRNTRFSLNGKVHPIVEYKIEVDLSDQGDFKMQDVFTKIEVVKNLNFTIGQMRVPFTIDAHRSPHLRYFANRSFIAKQAGNIRDVGATIGYKLNAAFPIQLEAGIFNGSGQNEQRTWHKSMSYSGKAQLMFIDGMNLTLSAQSAEPGNVRMNLFDAGCYYKFHHFHIEGEYLYKIYYDDLFDDVYSLNSFICYDLKLKKHFEKISFLLRYDMMTDHNSGVIDQTTNTLKVTDYSRRRITGGITLSIDKPFVADIRLNYENYFYKKSGIPKESEQDKFVIEFLTRF